MYNVHLLIILERGCSSIYRRKDYREVTVNVFKNKIGHNYLVLKGGDYKKKKKKKCSIFENGTCMTDITDMYLKQCIIDKKKQKNCDMRYF